MCYSIPFYYLKHSVLHLLSIVIFEFGCFRILIKITKFLYFKQFQLKNCFNKYLTDLIMYQLCGKCHHKPALTKCIKGKMCLSCGNNCHFISRKQQVHPIEYIINEIPKAKHNQLQHLRSKSMACLPNLQTLSASVPKRHSKITPQQRLHLNQSQHQFKTLSNNKSKLLTKTNFTSKKTLNVITQSSNPNFFDKNKNRKPTQYSQQQGLQNSNFKGRRSPNIQNIEVNIQKSNKKCQSERRQGSQQILSLKMQIRKKDELIEHLKLKLKKQKATNKKIHQNYQQKLMLIRKIKNR